MTAREKLIELLRKAKSSMWGQSGLSCELARNSYIAEYLIANGVTFASDTNVGSKWIPVTERLPRGANCEEICENVIAYLNRGDGYVCTGWLCGSSWWLIVGEDEDHTRWKMDDVTHWMPLPEPPKEE